MDYARQRLDLCRVVAITTTDNAASCALLEKLGFCFERPVQLRPDDEELKLFALELGSDEKDRH